MKSINDPPEIEQAYNTDYIPAIIHVRKHYTENNKYEFFANVTGRDWRGNRFIIDKGFISDGRSRPWWSQFLLQEIHKGVYASFLHDIETDNCFDRKQWKRANINYYKNQRAFGEIWILCVICFIGCEIYRYKKILKRELA